MPSDFHSFWVSSAVENFLFTQTIKSALTNWSMIYELIYSRLSLHSSTIPSMNWIWSSTLSSSPFLLSHHYNMWIAKWWSHHPSYVASSLWRWTKRNSKDYERRRAQSRADIRWDLCRKRTAWKREKTRKGFLNWKRFNCNLSVLPENDCGLIVVQLCM